MKVSKVVLVVVALHVLVIGGIFVFEGCSRSKTPALTENDTQPLATGDVAQTVGPANPVAPVTENHLTAATATPTPAPVATATPSPAPVAAAATAATPAPAPAATVSYAVKKGDSLYKIAKANKITIEQLARANNLSKSSVLQVGQKLNIPAAVATASAPAPTTVATAAPAPVTALSATTGASSYEVQLGDSLWKIAKTQGTTVAALKKANNLTSDALKVGQKLTLPAKAAAATAAAAPVSPAPAATTTPTSSATTTPAAPVGPAVIAPGISVR